MNSETRKMLEEAFAQDDIAIAAYERLQRHMQQRSGDDAVYETNAEARPMKQQSAAMNDETASQWNNWARVHIDVFGREVLTPARGQVISEVRHQLRAEIAELRNEVAELRDDPPVAVLIDGKITKMLGRNASDAA